jgi:hypothetical protein
MRPPSPVRPTSMSPALSVEVARAVVELVAAIPGVMRGEAEGHSLPEGVQQPFTVEEHPGAFVVRSAEGRQLAWVYTGEPKADDLTQDEARRIAAGNMRLGGAGQARSETTRQSGSRR